MSPILLLGFALAAFFESVVVEGTAPPVFASSLQASVVSTMAWGGRTSTGRATLWWSAPDQAFRVDEVRDESELVTSTLVLASARRVYSFSANSSLCVVSCVPPVLPSSLPRLGVQGNNSAGQTFPNGHNQWLRRTNVGSVPTNGRFNCSALTTLALTSLPQVQDVQASYSLHDMVVAKMLLQVTSWRAGPVNPALLVVPPACLNLSPDRCYLPLLHPPYPIALGLFYPESVTPFGLPEEKCACE